MFQNEILYIYRFLNYEERKNIMDKYIHYHSAEDWQQEIDRSEHIISVCTKIIESLEEDKKGLFISKKRKEDLNKKIKLMCKFIDDEEMALRKFYKEKRKYIKEEVL